MKQATKVETKDWLNMAEDYIENYANKEVLDADNLILFLAEYMANQYKKTLID